MNLGWGAAMRPAPMGPPLGADGDDALPTFRVMDPHHMPFFVPPRGTRLTVESQLIEGNSLVEDCIGATRNLMALVRDRNERAIANG